MVREAAFFVLEEFVAYYLHKNDSVYLRHQTSVFKQSCRRYSALYYT